MAKAKKEVTESKSVTKRKKIQKEAGKKEKKNKNLIQRTGYRIYFLDPNTDQQLMTDLRNTGKVISEATVMNVTPNDRVDEVVVIVRD